MKRIPWYHFAYASVLLVLCVGLGASTRSQRRLNRKIEILETQAWGLVVTIERMGDRQRTMSENLASVQSALVKPGTRKAHGATAQLLEIMRRSIMQQHLPPEERDQWIMLPDPRYDR